VPDKSGDLQPGELTQRVEPVYPPEALAERIEGTVRLDAVIDAEGNVKSVQVLSGPKQLLDAASEAVRKWHYSPTLLNGMPIQTERQVTIRFQLAPNQPN
jgi:TonB family protein